MEVIVRSVPMYYEEFGTGIPVLMLHGWPADHRHIAADMEPLFQHRAGWRRIYPDLPGMGKTPGASWITHQDHMLEIVVAFLQHGAQRNPVRWSQVNSRKMAMFRSAHDSPLGRSCAAQTVP